MDRITRYKGLLTKAYNTGSYKTIQDFDPLIQKYQINYFEYYCFIKKHLEKLLSNPPKSKKKHEEWHVYFYFLNDKPEPVYIGKTYNVLGRLRQHIKQDSKYDKVGPILVMNFDSETDALDYEKYYTEHFQPEWNISNKGEPPSYKLPKKEINIELYNPYSPSMDFNFGITRDFQEKINNISL